jgi:hypothetical protein
MAKAPKKAETTVSAKDLKEKIAAILHSNGFEGQKCAGEIVKAVEEFTGEVLSDESEETEAA